MRRGDFIEVHQYEFNGTSIKETWLKAQVIHVGLVALSVRFVNESTRLLTLMIRDRGRTWR
jgi:hypothetical protein